MIDNTKDKAGPLAKVNLKTKGIVLYIERIFIAAKKLCIPPNTLVYYALSHELGHILYQSTDKTQTEEYFAHNYAVKDTRCIYLDTENPGKDIIYKKLERLQKILLLD